MICGVLARASRAAASAGMCSAWQMWQAVSGPLVCLCRKEPPAAKKSSAAHASSASARCIAVRPKLDTPQCISDTLAYHFRRRIEQVGCWQHKRRDKWFA